MSTPATPPAVNPWAGIALAVIPELLGIVTSILNLRKKYSQLTAEQIAAVLVDVTGQADSAFDRVIARAAAVTPAAPTPTVQIP